MYFLRYCNIKCLTNPLKANICFVNWIKKLKSAHEHTNKDCLFFLRLWKRKYQNSLVIPSSLSRQEFSRWFQFHLNIKLFRLKYLYYNSNSNDLQYGIIHKLLFDKSRIYVAVFVQHDKKAFVNRIFPYYANFKQYFIPLFSTWNM